MPELLTEKGAGNTVEGAQDSRLPSRNPHLPDAFHLHRLKFFTYPRKMLLIKKTKTKQRKQIMDIAWAGDEERCVVMKC